MDKVIRIDGRDVGFRATALTPRLYRHKIGRDIIKDMGSLQAAYIRAMRLPEGATEEDRLQAQLSATNLEIFENAAFIMSRQYDSSIPDTPDEWLDQFATFSIYEILPELLDLWAINNTTIAKPKKK